MIESCEKYLPLFTLGATTITSLVLLETGAIPSLPIAHDLGHWFRGKHGVLSLYNEERRLGVQRGSDTLIVLFVTSNDGLSVAIP